MPEPKAMKRIECGLLLGALLITSMACDPTQADGKVSFTTGVVEVCPLVTAVTVLPLEVLVGGTLDVSADMSAGAQNWLWTATAGHFDNPSADHTLYHCDVGGTHMLTFTVSASHVCADAVDVPITCSYSALCGDGKIDRGEECDDGNRRPQDGCSARCVREPLEAMQP